MTDERLDGPRAPDDVIEYILPGRAVGEAHPIDSVTSRAIRAGLRHIHIQNAREPVRYPTTGGAFPATLLASVPPVVVDANILRDDVLYASGHDQRTSLTNAANAGLIRLFSAGHVVDEVREHSGRWTCGTQVSRQGFLQRWLFEYLPLTRVLDIGDDGLAMLTPDERSRIERLRLVDPDDVRSAVLSMLLGAFYLTRDGEALRAAYGPDVNAADYEKWRDVLRAGGDAGELGMMFQVSAQVALAAGRGAANGIGALARRFGWPAVVAATVGAALLLTKAPPEHRRRARSVLNSACSTIGELMVVYQEASIRLRAVSVKAPQWDELASLIAPPELLTRACIYTLARSGMSDQSAESLAALLPQLGVPQGEAKVRAILRARSSYFSQPWAGRYQLGHVAEPVRRQLDLVGTERSESLAARATGSLSRSSSVEDADAQGGLGG